MPQPGHTPNCHQAYSSVCCPHSDLTHRRAIPHTTGKRHTGIYTAVQPDLFRHPARHYPPGHRLPSTRQLAMQTGLHRNTISKVYRQLETDGVVEAMAGSGIYVRDQQKRREIKTPAHIHNRGVTDLDREVRNA